MECTALDGMVPCFLLSVILDKLFYISELHFLCVQVNDLIVSLHFIFKDKNDVCNMPVWFVVVPQSGDCSSVALCDTL